ncbi:MAG: alkaline phosphatase [Bryobacteraceae bacterium]|nr:alkaline phosphatase [Bryobacteraceae bacterium]
MTTRIALTLFVCALLPVAAQTGRKRGTARAKNVILLLADAGGISTVNAASIHGHGAPQKLFVQSWPHIALSDTSPVRNWVSDSAAGMTAIVTGQKTLNGVISQGADAERGKRDGTTLKTLLEYAEERGLSTGVMSNVTITDATPAACYGHANDRRKWGEIFLQLFAPRFGDGVDFLYGPGRKRIWEDVKALGKDADAVAAAAGRPVYTSLGGVPATERRPLVVVDGGPELADAARKAIQTLSRNPKGYFLMIESDAHTDDPRAGLDRLVAFDALIREIAALTKPSETLLLFTADHSFDLRIVSGPQDKPVLEGYDEWKKGNEGKAKKDPPHLRYLKVDGSHTAEEVLVAAMGPGAEAVRGYLPNTAIFGIIMKAWGWQPKS